MVKKVLIVEDNIIIAIDIQGRIESFGYSVPAIVASGDEALVKASELKPDLVLMDIGLKGKMTGIEAGKKIREDLKIPVLYLTGNRNLLKQNNITDPCIDKPYNDLELKKLINQLLDSSDTSGTNSTSIIF